MGLPGGGVKGGAIEGEKNMKAKVELACKIEKEGGRMECIYVRIIIGGGEGDEGALFCKTEGRGEKLRQDWPEPGKGRSETPPQLAPHPSILLDWNQAQVPVPARTF